jgi:hypothetical protein
MTISQECKKGVEYIKEVARGRTSKKTDTIMAKGKVTKDKQYHGQTESDKRTNCNI